MRRKKKIKRPIIPDPKYNSVTLTRFINHAMIDGKKSTAQKIIYKTMTIIEEQTKTSPIDVLNEAIKNASPMLEIKSRRIGGANYQVPMPVRGDRKTTLAMRWVIEAARAKKGKPMHEKLAAEILDASKNTGDAVRKKENTHRMAEANKAFARFAW